MNAEIEKLKESIKRFKAERIYRNKKELERYNKIMKKFKKFRELTITKPEDPWNIQIATALQRKREHLAEVILSKLKAFARTYNYNPSRLTEEYIIESQMLTTTIESIFKEVEVQVDGEHFRKNVAINATPEMQDAEIETEQIFNCCYLLKKLHNFFSVTWKSRIWWWCIRLCSVPEKRHLSNYLCKHRRLKWTHVKNLNFPSGLTKLRI